MGVVSSMTIFLVVWTTEIRGQVEVLCNHSVDQLTSPLKEVFGQLDNWPFELTKPFGQLKFGLVSWTTGI